MEYPWYIRIENSNSLLQGDFITECPIVIPPSILQVNITADFKIELIDSIILSQSCDLENNNLQIVLVCPYFPLKTFIENMPTEQSSSHKAILKTIDNLRKGIFPGYHLLDKKDGFFNDYQVVDFRSVYGIHIETLKSISQALKGRIRLLPPYREHLSQSFARYFMRVGLPQDIKIEGY